MYAVIDPWVPEILRLCGTQDEALRHIKKLKEYERQRHLLIFKKVDDVNAALTPVA